MNKRPAFLSSTIAVAGDNPVLGTWKLKSIIHEVTATGEKIHEFGEHPSGYISYSADGRMYAIGTADNRVKPLAANPTDEQRVKLHQTMFAYAGTYTLEGDKVTHHVDISWNEKSYGKRPSPVLQTRREHSYDYDTVLLQKAARWSRSSRRSGLGKGKSAKFLAPPERLKGIQATRRKADTSCGDAGGRMSMVGPSELFDRSRTSTPVRTTTSPSIASSAVDQNAAQHQKGCCLPLARA